ncbi:hypothetical protein HJG53_12620 [Sphingomonas sp. ID1715]|uniref:hypothetical protein n=1 Tax=Sphingomonas sp. ID1715 TaxID=1656898 RepID=UPI001837A4ED|nr:hypothetical protein [Sphingomonas sp. ID1715]NNM77752.1 hypothetical protein [Sphingomonas sp. ID1715]
MAFQPRLPDSTDYKYFMPRIPAALIWLIYSCAPVCDKGQVIRLLAALLLAFSLLSSPAWAHPVRQSDCTAMSSGHESQRDHDMDCCKSSCTMAAAVALPAVKLSTPAPLPAGMAPWPSSASKLVPTNWAAIDPPPKN